MRLGRDTNAEVFRRHRIVNVLQSVVLVLGMAFLFGLCGWIVAGQEGLIALLIASLILLVLAPRASPGPVLRSIGARSVAPDEAPEIHTALSELARRAGLEDVPRLCYVPWPDMTAFTIGRRGAAFVIVSAGLLRELDPRELVGVLAHEIAHVRNNDMWILGLADTVTRLTRFAATFGLLLLVVNLPLLAAGKATVSWYLVLALLLAPTVSALLQLGLSRTREFSADIEAAELTGDPEGLARALGRLEFRARAVWEALFGYGSRDPVPSLLRSHPRTGDRIERLLSLARRREATPMRLPERHILPDHLIALRRRPRWPWSARLGR